MASPLRIEWLGLLRLIRKVPWQTTLKVLCLVSLIIAANIAADRISDLLQFDMRPSNEDAVHAMIMICTAAYVALIALPFVPGLEIGLGLIALLGPPILFLVYVATIAGLSCGYALGCLVPARTLVVLFEQLRLTRAARLLETIEPMSTGDRLAFLVSKAPNRIVPCLLRYRYVALGLAINMPGNFLIGGGGGIALLAGTSGLFSFPGFVLAIALAVSPLPLAVLFLGGEAMGL